MKSFQCRLRGVMFAAFMAMAGAACAARGETATAAYDRDRITFAEIETVDARTSVHDIVQRLRPNWLRGRGQVSLRSDVPVAVYLNGQRVGGTDMMLRYAAADLREIHYLDSIKATQPFGTGHVNGAILITLK